MYMYTCIYIYMYIDMYKYVRPPCIHIHIYIYVYDIHMYIHILIDIHSQVICGTLIKSVWFINDNDWNLWKSMGHGASAYPHDWAWSFRRSLARPWRQAFFLFQSFDVFCCFKWFSWICLICKHFMDVFYFLCCSFYLLPLLFD